MIGAGSSGVGTEDAGVEARGGTKGGVGAGAAVNEAMGGADAEVGHEDMGGSESETEVGDEPRGGACAVLSMELKGLSSNSVFVTVWSSMPAMRTPERALLHARGQSGYACGG